MCESDSRSPGRARHKPKNHCVRGCRAIPVYSLLLVCVLPLPSAHEAAGATAPGIPHALFGRKINARLGRIAPRDREVVFGIRSAVIASAAKQSIFLSLRGKMDCFASLAMTVPLF